MKKFLIAFIALTLGSVASAATLKIATVTPEGSQWMKDMRDSAKEIKERTDGRVQIKYYGGGVMGNDTKVLGKIRIGALQGGAFTPAALADSYPNLNIYGMPLVFDSEEEAAYVRERLDGKLQEGLEAAGFVNFGFASGGFAIVMSNTPVKSLEDLKGKRVWVPEGDSISYASMEALSLAPVTLPLTDVLTGLQTGLIDIVAMSPIGALVLQWHTKIKYVTEIPLVYTVGFMAIDRRNFDRVNLEDNREARDALLNTGIESVAFDAQEVARLRERLLESNRRLGAKGAFDMALYDEMMGYVEEYREADSEAVAGSQ
jgi:TRAP-type C4-dicarboxylate transport system substrate-binding protein